MAEPFLALITPLSQSPGVPTHPIVTPQPPPGVPTHPIYNPAFPAHPIANPPPGSPPVYPSQLPSGDPSGYGWQWAYAPASGWSWVYVPVPPEENNQPGRPIEGVGPAHPIAPTRPTPKV